MNLVMIGVIVEELFKALIPKAADSGRDISDFRFTAAISTQSWWVRAQGIQWRRSLAKFDRVELTHEILFIELDSGRYPREIAARFAQNLVGTLIAEMDAIVAEEEKL